MSRHLDRSALLHLALFYAFFATIPLVWVRLLGTTIAPYHVFAAFLLAAVPFLPGAIDAIKDALKSGKVLWLTCGLLIAAMLISFSRPESPFEPFFFVKFVSFYATAIITAVLVLLIIRRGLFSWLALAPAIAGGAFLIFISLQFIQANIDPLALIGLAIQRADPNIVMNQVFRAAFAAGNEEISYRSNLKQSLSFAFLLLVPLGVLAQSFMPKERVLLRAVSWAGIVFAVVMTIAPFSRAGWLALAMIVACYLMMLVRTPKGMALLLGGLLLSIPGFVFVASQSELFGLIEARLSANDSVDVRFVAVEEHWQAIGRSPFFGRTEEIDGWAHNVVIDAWSGFGLLGLVGALLFFVAMGAMLVKALLLAFGSRQADRKIHVAIAAFMCPALVRMLTAPNVTIDFPVWIGLGIAAGIAADAWQNRRGAAASPTSAGPPMRPQPA